MLIQTEGIVLNSTKYSESSLITTVFTKEQGIFTIISSKGKSKGSKSHLFQLPFSLVQLVCYFKRTQQIHRLKEIQFHKNYREDISHVIKNSVRYFIAELLNKIIKEEEQNIELYTYLENKCLELNNCTSVDPNFLLNFLCSLSEHLGFFPNLSEKRDFFNMQQGEFITSPPPQDSYLNKADSALLYRIFMGEGKFTRLERKMGLNLLIRYYSYQLDQEITLKSKAVIEVIFS